MKMSLIKARSLYAQMSVGVKSESFARVAPDNRWNISVAYPKEECSRD